MRVPVWQKSYTLIHAHKRTKKARVAQRGTHAIQCKYAHAWGWISLCVLSLSDGERCLSGQRFSHQTQATTVAPQLFIKSPRCSLCPFMRSDLSQISANSVVADERSQPWTNFFNGVTDQLLSYYRCRRCFVQSLLCALLRMQAHWVALLFAAVFFY